jgi:hypothetical protein
MLKKIIGFFKEKEYVMHYDWEPSGFQSLLWDIGFWFRYKVLKEKSPGIGGLIKDAYEYRWNEEDN